MCGCCRISSFRTGISAYVLKDDPLSDLMLALQAVSGGGTYFSTMAPTALAKHMKELEEKDMSERLFKSLSLRERDVFKYLAEGENIRKIADRLSISPKTVESHKYNIMEKLQVSSVVELTKFAIKKNLINV